VVSVSLKDFLKKAWLNWSVFIFNKLK